MIVFLFIVYEFSIKSLFLFGCGKVCDIYVVDDDCLLFVIIDCISVFDVVMGEIILMKGVVLM